ncbi:MAG: hypothetical protein OHK0022_30450 [Roseiflexaceae bacterium]
MAGVFQLAPDQLLGRARWLQPSSQYCTRGAVAECALEQKHVCWPEMRGKPATLHKARDGRCWLLRRCVLCQRPTLWMEVVFPNRHGWNSVCKIRKLMLLIIVVFG